MSGNSIPDPLARLRAFQRLAPWNLRDLSAIAGAILSATRISPLNDAARAHPGERAIRFYVARGIVHAPDGRGTAAKYGYRHLLQVLAIKMRQMDGLTLAEIAEEFDGMSGDQMERRVALALGPALPTPEQVSATGPHPPRGRIARIQGTEGTTRPSSARTQWIRLDIRPGVELHVAQDHPLGQSGDFYPELARAVDETLARYLPEQGR